MWDFNALRVSRNLLECLSLLLLACKHERSQSFLKMSRIHLFGRNINAQCCNKSSTFTTPPIPKETKNKTSASEIHFPPSRSLEITEIVSFNIASDASYVYILSGQKLIKNAENGPFWRVFEDLKPAVKQCYQTGQF